MRTMRTVSGTCLATIILAGSAIELASQAPGVPTSSHGCLRPDLEKSKEALRKAMASGADADYDSVMVLEEVDGCVFYTVTFVSSVVVVSDVPGEGSRKISGRGAITFGLSSDVSEPDYELTSGPADLTAPIFWSGAEITPGNNCTVTVAARPFTAFSFWLGIRNGAEPHVAVQITPAGDEAHPTKKKCPTPTGRSIEVPGREQIFTPAWMALHGQGGSAADQAGVAAQPGMDIAALTAQAKAQSAQPSPMTDIEKLKAMADKAKGKEPSPTEMMAMMREVVPDLDQQVEAARHNFRLEMPGDCAAGAGGTFRCSVKRTIRLPDGKGTTQNITESTEITIAKASGGAAKAPAPRR